MLRELLPIVDPQTSLDGPWHQCKLRGRRAAELAAGDLTRRLEAMAVAMRARVTQDTLHLASQEQGKVLNDLELGQAFVLMSLSLKHQHYKEAGW